MGSVALRNQLSSQSNENEWYSPTNTNEPATPVTPAAVIEESETELSELDAEDVSMEDIVERINAINEMIPKRLRNLAER